MICPTGKAKYFFAGGWTLGQTGKTLICPSGKINRLFTSPRLRGEGDERART
jgi:hypothetical protein